MALSHSTLISPFLFALPCVPLQVLLTVLPVVVRMHYLKKHIPLDLRTFDLRNFNRVRLTSPSRAL